MLVKFEGYRWPSYQFRIGLNDSELLDSGAEFRLVLHRPKKQQFVVQRVDKAESAFITQQVLKKGLTDHKKIVDTVEYRAGLRVEAGSA